MAKPQKKPTKKPGKGKKALASAPIIIPPQTITVSIPPAMVPPQTVTAILPGDPPQTLAIEIPGTTLPTQSVTFEIPSQTLTVSGNSDCCEACDAIQTGHWGIPWRDAAGTWQCLEGVTGKNVVKVLQGDENGPFWGNA